MKYVIAYLPRNGVCCVVDYLDQHGFIGVSRNIEEAIKFNNYEQAKFRLYRIVSGNRHNYDIKTLDEVLVLQAMSS